MDVNDLVVQAAQKAAAGTGSVANAAVMQTDAAGVTLLESNAAVAAATAARSATAATEARTAATQAAAIALASAAASIADSAPPGTAASTNRSANDGAAVIASNLASPSSSSAPPSVVSASSTTPGSIPRVGGGGGSSVQPSTSAPPFAVSASSTTPGSIPRGSGGGSSVHGAPSPGSGGSGYDDLPDDQVASAAATAALDAVVAASPLPDIQERPPTFRLPSDESCVASSSGRTGLGDETEPLVLEGMDQNFVQQQLQLQQLHQQQLHQQWAESNAASVAMSAMAAIVRQSQQSQLSQSQRSWASSIQQQHRTKPKHMHPNEAPTPKIAEASNAAEVRAHAAAVAAALPSRKGQDEIRFDIKLHSGVPSSLAYSGQCPSIPIARKSRCVSTHIIWAAACEGWWVFVCVCVGVGGAQSYYTKL